MIRLNIENPAEIIVEAGEMLQDNWAETGFNFPFAPSAEMYQSMYDAGVMVAAVARDGAGQVIAYCSLVVMPHPHNPAVKLGANDALFVAKPHRGGSVTYRLLKFVEAAAKAMGATMFSWHTRAGTPFAAMLIKRGYTPADTIVMRAL